MKERPFTPKKPQDLSKSTSWQKVHNWYDSIVGEEGHYYHKHIILPNVLRLLTLQNTSSLLDLASGQGVLARAIPETVDYVGVDLAKDLIAKAERYEKNNKRHNFLVGDITKPIPSIQKNFFTHAVCILALQNIKTPQDVFLHLKHYIKPNGTVVLVLNHPCFRIPRHTHWGFDEKTKTQFRKINLYMTPLEIPITCHPGKQPLKGAEQNTWSFHFPLSSLTQGLTQNKFFIESIEEWCSDKESIGKAAPWENRARKEFPLFVAIKARYFPIS